MYVRTLAGEIYPGRGRKENGTPSGFCFSSLDKNFFVLLWGSACYTAPLVGLTGKEVFIYGGKRIVRAEHPSRGTA
jgi:hypothetical protein